MSKSQKASNLWQKLFSRNIGGKKHEHYSKKLRLETLESRQLLAVTLPVIANQTVLTGAPLNIPLDSSGTTNAVSYSVAIDNSNVAATIPTGNTFLKFHVTDTADGINGDMVFQLFNDLAPNTVARITSLVNGGFYNGLTFHRIIDNFMIQGGDPLGNGSGGPGFKFDDEFNANLQFTSSGVLAMVNSGPDTNGSQFFITDAPYRFGDFRYSIFGLLVEGESVRNAINNVPTNSGDRPINTVTITSATIVTDPQDGILRLSAAIGATGTAVITVTARDVVTNETSVRQFTATVAPDTNNDPPFLNTINPIQTTVNTPITFNIPATDVEGNAINYGGIVSPANSNLTLTVNSTTGSVTLTPSASLAPGVYSVLLGVSVSGGYSWDTQLVPVYINPAAPTSIQLRDVSDTGDSNTDGVTKLNNTAGTTLEFQVNGVISGRTVQLYSDGTLIGEAIATGTSIVITTNGTVTLTDGPHAITAKQIVKDQAVNVGNLSTTTDLVSPASASLAITVDTVSPVFDFTPVTTAAVGVPYTCQVTVAPPTAGVTFALTELPTGMVIDPVTGLITWTPSVGQTISGQVITVKATDLAGNSAQTSYTLGGNNAPVLVSVNQAPAIGPTMGHTSKDSVFNTDFSSFINNGSGTTIITDPDTGAVVGGIAITFAGGKGKWEYSLDGGVTFVQFSPINSSLTSLLLPHDAKLRYTPDGHNSESAIITYRAWDMTTGTSGSIVDLASPTLYGGTTAFSAGYDSAQLFVNDAPVLTPANPSLGTTNEETPITVTLINSFINHGAGTTIITDPNDNATVGGIAIIGFSGNGTWEYKPLISSGYLPLPSDLSLSSALILSKNATSLRYIPDGNNSEIATITYIAWDNTFSSNNKRVDLSQSGSTGGTTAFSIASDTASITVTSVNDAPVLTLANPMMGSTVSDTPKTISLSGTFINNGAGTTTITDVDNGAVIGGIALMGVAGNGTWEYSIDGSTFNVISPFINDSSALLLSRDAQLRYTPSSDNSVPATITYRAWDTTSGVNGGIVDLSLSGSLGGSTAFSTATDTAMLFVVNVNHAPVLTPANPVIAITDEDTEITISLSNTFINNGTGTTTITDSDVNNPVGGIALIGVTGQGTWSYSLDGSTYTLLGSASPSLALLLPKLSYLRYTPDGKNGETATIIYRAWDTSTGITGAIVDLSQPNAVGGSTAFSSMSDFASLTVTSINDAPVLTPALPSLGSTDDDISKTIDLSTFINNGTDTTTITDVDNGAIIGGIALVGTSGNGTWEYSLDGTTFFGIGTVSDSSALLLPKDAKLRYTPGGKGAESATINYRAWDTTSGTNGTKVDLSAIGAVGGATSFSVMQDHASLSVIDLNDPPTDISISNASVPENQPEGTPVGTFASTDPNTSDTFTYSLVSGEGSEDNASFMINGNTLQTAATFDYETKNVYNIRVRTTDQGGLWYEKAFTIQVSDQSEVFGAGSADWTDAGLTLKLDNDGKLHLYRTGSTTDAVPPQNPNFVTGINLIGRGEADDQLTVDLTGGNPIPSGGMTFMGSTHVNGDKLILKGSSGYDNVTLTNTQVNIAGAAPINYSQVELFGFDLGDGYDHLAIDHATLKIDQHNAISAGTDITIIGGTLDLGGKIVTVGDVKLVSGSILNGSLHAASYNILSGIVTATLSSTGELTKTTTGQLDAEVIIGESVTVYAGTLTATSIICDTLIIG